MNLWSMLTHMGKDDVLKKLIEDLSAAAVPLDMRVEQDGLGVRELLREV